MILCCLLLYLFFTFTTSPSIGSRSSSNPSPSFKPSKLDSIIKQHWERYQSFGTDSNEKRTNIQTNSPLLDNFVKPHYCQHHKFMKNSGTSQSKYSHQARAKLLSSPQLYGIEEEEDHKKRDLLNTTNLDNNSLPTSTPTPIPPPTPTPSSNDGWRSIRVCADNQWLSPSDSYTCSSVGQVVDVDEAYIDDNGRTQTQWSCSNQDILTTTKIKTLKAVVEAILDIVKHTLSVKPVVGNLVLSKTYHEFYGTQCRKTLTIPDYMITGAGEPDCDYYLMVSARPIVTASTLANALPCSHDVLPGNRFSRPLAGSINFNPSATSNISHNYFEFTQNIKTGLHEITHALGFTSDLFQDYITPEGGYYLTTTSKTTYNGGSKWQIITPRVVSFAQQHYNCSTLSGMELEDYNEGGEAGSHWESRLVDSEYMAGIASIEAQLSYLTLSFFEDMGWYKANFSMAEPWRYGIQEGCSWVQQPCSTETWNRYWCQTSASVSCNGQRNAVAYCNLVTFQSALPTEYQYFSQNTLGGKSGWNDYCPIYVGYSNTYCHDSAAYIASPNEYSEVVGPGSSCWDFKTPYGTAQGCFPTACIMLSGDTSVTLQVNIGGQWLQCPKNGGVVSHSTSKGTLQVTCPFVEFFCSETSYPVVNFTFDGKNNIPVSDAPTLGPRSGPSYPDSPGSGGIPIPPIVSSFFDDPFAVKVGSTTFWILVGVGILLVLLCALCCFHRSR
eukprot:TRINITY_DN5570_c0_g1_i1.p1 TRINITY_DN5570_c0_g1~~TRINITY_DN5570_c0_g1_i1.p1  ORF type:complete len:724 (+),score=119.82 TRINITY_DN5570_c0_g1_i1:3-2174(+)